jgi:hypothetical protein
MRLARVASGMSLVFLFALFIGCGEDDTSTVTSSPSPTPSASAPNYASTYSPLICRVTANEYACLKYGMTYDEVVGVIGSHHDGITEFQNEDQYQWVNEGVLAGGSYAQVTFQDGRVVFLAQSPLLPNVPGSEKLEPGEIEGNRQGDAGTEQEPREVP